jgi:hypothetical protein
MSPEKERYRIVFRGELAFGMSQEEVAAQLRERLKFSDAALARFFAGKPVVLKSNLDEETAERYAKALWGAGARCAVEPMTPGPVAVELAHRPDPPAPAMVCPKCGQSQPEAETCIGCGVVIVKFRQRQEESFAFESAAPGGGAAGDAVATDAMLAALAATRPWVRLVSVLLFIGAGLGLVAALVSMLAVGHAPGGPPAVLVGAIQVLACLLYLVPAWYLSRYAGALGSFLQGGAVSELEAALDHQKSFWKFVGILTLISIVLAVLGIAAAILIPALFVGR